jgi:hypothetical protein
VQEGQRQSTERMSRIIGTISCGDGCYDGLVCDRDDAEMAANAPHKSPVDAADAADQVVLAGLAMKDDGHVDLGGANLTDISAGALAHRVSQRLFSADLTAPAPKVVFATVYTFQKPKDIIEGAKVKAGKRPAPAAVEQRPVDNPKKKKGKRQ